MTFDDVKDKFSSLFRITTKILAPYTRLKYEPPQIQTIDDQIQRLAVWAGSWLFVGFVYVVSVYLWVYEKPGEARKQLTDFYTRPPAEVFNEIVAKLLISPFFNLSFLALMYLAITMHAEKTYLEGRFVHLKLSGLIKALTLGKFDISSRVAEQSNQEVQVARANICATVNDGSKELITIVSASGWDFFGTPAPTPPITPAQADAKKPFWKFWQWAFWSRIRPSKKDHVEGYLLEPLSQQFRKVQIILLDPSGTSAQERASAYLADGSHRPINDVAEYGKNISSAIENIKKAYKKNKNIELKLVDQLPQWKMVIVEGELWTQPIIPGVRSDHTPLYGFKKTEYSMYHSFWHLAEALWHDPKSKKVDLSK